MTISPLHPSIGLLAWHRIPPGTEKIKAWMAGTSPATTTIRPAGAPSGLRLEAAASTHAELLLQAGRGGGVLEHQLLVREHIMIGPLRHQCRLVEAAQDELDFARVPIDVADGENPGLVGLEACGVDRNELALAQLDAPLRHRPELHGEPEERQHGFAGERHARSVGALDHRARERAVAALERRDLPG